MALEIERSRWAGGGGFGRDTDRIREWARWGEEGEAVTNRRVNAQRAVN